VHFENASDGVVWGDGTLHVTTDGGARWRIPAGAPVDDLLAWSGGRIWALSCVNHRVCATRVPSVSDDGGSTWRAIAALDQSLNSGPIVATSRSDAYALEPASGSSVGQWMLAATTDGGASWQQRPTPCAFPYGYLASNGPILLLICRVTAAKNPSEIYTSDDRGITWAPQAAGPLGGSVSSLTNLGPVFVAGQHNGGLWSSSDGRSWNRAIRDAHFGWYLDALPGVGVWATNNDGSGSRIWFSADGVHWGVRAGG